MELRIKTMFVLLQILDLNCTKWLPGFEGTLLASHKAAKVEQRLQRSAWTSCQRGKHMVIMTSNSKAEIKSHVLSYLSPEAPAKFKLWVSKSRLPIRDLHSVINYYGIQQPG